AFGLQDDEVRWWREVERIVKCLQLLTDARETVRVDDDDGLAGAVEPPVVERFEVVRLLELERRVAGDADLRYAVRSGWRRQERTVAEQSGERHRCRARGRRNSGTRAADGEQCCRKQARS